MATWLGDSPSSDDDDDDDDDHGQDLKVNVRTANELRLTPWFKKEWNWIEMGAGHLLRADPGPKNQFF